MSALKPFFSYFGAKHRIAGRYPTPQHELIVEPFAGSAAYACRYPERAVVLCDRNPVIAGLWRWLTRASSDEILALPLLEPEQSVDELDVREEAAWLIGFWLHKGSIRPGKTLVRKWGAEFPTQFWGENIRARVAAQVAAVRHWQVLEGTYADLPALKASWFIDPPYTGKLRNDVGRAPRHVGARYPFGTKQLDFEHLGAWCQQLPGQVIVCENVGATWLPFEPFHDAKANVAGGTTREAIWTAGCA